MWYEMFRNNYGSVLWNIPRYFPGLFFNREAAKTPQVNVIVVCQRVFDSIHKGINYLLNFIFVETIDQVLEAALTDAQAEPNSKKKAPRKKG